MEHVSLLTVQKRTLWQQNHHCSRGFSKFIPFLHTSPYLLISHCHWCCCFSYYRPHFSGKRVHLRDKKHGTLMHFKISPCTQGTRVHLCNLYLPLTHLFSLELWQIGETPVSEFTSSVTTQRASGLISQEEYTRL